MTRRTLLPALILLPFAAHAQVMVNAKSAIVLDAGTGKVLWSKDADTPRYPASTTKVMTGLLLVEHCLKSDVITAPADVENVKEASMHLKPGEKVTAENMLYALMLRSANDGCYAVAVHIAGSVDNFAKMMNERAKEIGCLHTNFHNPHGLNDPIHMTTARDLALIGREAMKYEWFREVVRTRKHIIARSINQKDTHMISKNKWLIKDPSADGIKTGYTKPAGLCYVGSATRGGFRIITSLMKSDNWQKDHQAMLNWAFKYYEKKDEVKAGDLIGSAKVTGGTATEVELIAQTDTYALGRKGVQDVERIVSTTETPAPIKEGDILGTLILRDKEGFEQKVPLVARQAVAMSTSYAVTKSAQSNGWAVALGSLMFIGAYVARGRSRRPRYGKGTKKTRR